MNILLTAHRFWPHVGGTEEAVERLAQRYAAQGHGVTVATMQEDGTPLREERDKYVVQRFAMKRVGKFRFPPPEYARFVKRREWDIVHVHGQRVWSSDYLYRHFKHIPARIVFTAHGFYQWHMEHTPVIDDAYYRVVLPRALRHAARVTALTGNEAQELRSWGVPAEKIVRIADGFDPGEFAALPSGFRERHGLGSGPLLLYVGGFYRNKRVDRLIEVAAKTGATLAVIGKDQDPEKGQPYCEALAARLGADVKFLGRVPREDVLSAYNESDVLLLGSDFEGFGLVLLEAMAAGLPFVSTPSGAAPDLAALGAGLLAEGTDGMVAAVEGLLADEPRRRTLGAAGRREVQAFTWERVADDYLALFEEVARK